MPVTLKTKSHMSTTNIFKVLSLSKRNLKGKTEFNLAYTTNITISLKQNFDADLNLSLDSLLKYFKTFDKSQPQYS